MFASYGSPGGADRRQGGRRVSFAELRHSLAKPSRLNEDHRQRLIDLAQRVARVQALGGGYRRVSLSDHASAAISQEAAV
jgi:hypothetical protein